MIKFSPDIHHSKSIRLRGYDYSQDGVCFVTICMQNRECMFGEIKDGTMILNDAGKMIDIWWKKIFEKYSDIFLDNYVVMPNHFHGIIQITTNNVGAIPCNRPETYKNDKNIGSGENMVIKGENMVSPLRIVNTYDGLGKYISWFKRMSTNEYIRNVKQNNWKPFEKRLWQRNYYEHIIRTDKSLNEIREYIISNPVNWEKDELYNLL